MTNTTHAARELPNTVEARHAANRVEALEVARGYAAHDAAAVAAIDAELGPAREALEAQYAAHEAQHAEVRANVAAGRFTITPGRLA